MRTTQSCQGNEGEVRTQVRGRPVSRASRDLAVVANSSDLLPKCEYLALQAVPRRHSKVRRKNCEES
jgi:hypothetical protein